MPAQSFLPRGVGASRRGFEALCQRIVKVYPQAIRVVYEREIKIIFEEIVDNTPIDTGAAAGVLSNSVGSQKRSLYSGHKAYGYSISNEVGGSGWQLLDNSTADRVVYSITNPQWNTYLKFLEHGIVEPIAPAKSHWVHTAWKHFEKRRDKIREDIRRAVK